MSMRRRIASYSLAALPLLAGCASRTRDAWEADPGAVAGTPFELRSASGAETSRVTRGAGFSLAGRSKADLALARPLVAQRVALLRRVFPGDTALVLTADVRRADEPRACAVGACTALDLVLPPLRREGDDERRGPRGGMGPRGAGRDPLAAVNREFLDRHASARAAMGAKGRLRDWARDAILAIGADSAAERWVPVLNAHPEDLIPAWQLLTIDRPSGGVEPVAEGPAPAGRPDLGRGGMGGPGGGRPPMGGQGAMGARGGVGRNGMPVGDIVPTARLTGGALFSAEALSFGHYVTREGPAVLGAIIDAQLDGRAVDEALTANRLPTTARIDDDFTRWLAARAEAIRARR